MSFHVHGLREKLRFGKFVVTAEVEPPKGNNPTKALENVSKIRHLVDAVNISDSPMATMRMNPFSLGHLVQENLGVEVIPHFTCRDRNVIGIQSELLGASALGLRNFLSLTGDACSRGDHPQAKGVFEVDTVGLIKIAQQLSLGLDYSGNPLSSIPDFFIGAAANPGADDLEREVKRLEEKVEAGARFIQTQPVFSKTVVERFLEATGYLDVPILFGLMPLKSYKMALNVHQNVPGITLRDEALTRIESGGREQGVQVVAEVFQQIQSVVSGVHLYPIGDVTLVNELFAALGKEAPSATVLTTGE